MNKNKHTQREDLAKEKNYTCNKCSAQLLLANGEPDWNNIILDNIQPVLLGGQSFDKTNLQILCHACSMEKDTTDNLKIKENKFKIRRLVRLKNKGQLRLVE